MEISDGVLIQAARRQRWAAGLSDDPTTEELGKARLSAWRPPSGGGIDPRPTLITVIERSADIDWLLHLTQKRYRDHAHHPRSVALLGDFLLDAYVNEKQSLASYSWDSISNSFTNQEEVRISWWIAALLHDHAYPLAHMLQYFGAASGGGGEQCAGQKAMRDLLDRHFRELYRRTDAFERVWECPGMGGRKEAARRALHEHLVGPGFLNEDELNRLIGGSPDQRGNEDELEHVFEHGLWSAANLAAHFKGTKWESRHTWRCFQVMRPAIRAMAFHSGPSHFRIDLDKEPVAFLLLLCDELQEWGRQMFGEVAGTAESDSIDINLLVREDGRLSFDKDKPFAVQFSYPDDGRLRETKWSFGRFQADKSSALRRLVVVENPKRFCLQEISFHVRVPCCVHLAGEVPSRPD
ncbi:MAG: hypothetical protein JXA57_02390 [Armatimonadetes bacterium]|nr:hypothetical protein [Armatimonadota bacterium]